MQTSDTKDVTFFFQELQDTMLALDQHFLCFMVAKKKLQEWMRLKVDCLGTSWLTEVLSDWA